MKAKINTWKIGSWRYLHEIEIPKAWFYIVTDSSYFSLSSFTLRNKILSKRNTKEIKGLKLIHEKTEELSNEELAKLCFGGTDNMEFRIRAYGKELKKIKISMLVYFGGRVEFIERLDRMYSGNILHGSSAYLARNIRKRIKNPLPHIVNKRVIINDGKSPHTLYFTVSELSWIMFTKKIESWSL